MKRQLEKYEEIERSLITSYRKKIWNKFLEAINEYEMIKPRRQNCCLYFWWKRFDDFSKMFSRVKSTW